MWVGQQEFLFCFLFLNDSESWFFPLSSSSWKKTFSRWKEKKFSQSWNGICWIWHILLFQKIIHGSDFQVRFSPFEHLPFLFWLAPKFDLKLTLELIMMDGCRSFECSLQWGNLNEGLVLSWEDALLHCYTATLPHCFTASLLHCYTAAL